MEQESGYNLQEEPIDPSVYRALGRLEGKLDILLQMLNDHIRKDEIAWGKVTDLEKKIVYAAGIISVVVFAITSGVMGLLRKLGI